MAETPKKAKSKKSKAKAGARKSGSSKMTKFRIWCMKKGITQINIHDETYLSLGSINNMWHIGKSNDSTILLMSIVYKIDFDELKKLITTFED